MKKSSKKLSNYLLVIGIILLWGGVFSCSESNGDDAPEAQVPTIASISPDVTTTINSVVDLKVGVSVTDKGSLSYQWYKAGDKLSNGEEIAGAAEAVFSPETGTAGLTYYYCVVTNRLG